MIGIRPVLSKQGFGFKKSGQGKIAQIVPFGDFPCPDLLKSVVNLLKIGIILEVLKVLKGHDIGPTSGYLQENKI